MCIKWLPAETTHMTVLPAETLSRKQDHLDRLGRKTFIMYNSLDRKQRSQAVLVEAKYDGQSRQEGKIGGLVYTLSSRRLGFTND